MVEARVVVDTPDTRPNGLFTVGDRVRHIDTRLTGVIEVVTPERIRVKWDHLRLAYSALGQMFDYRKHHELEREAVSRG